MVAPFAGGLGEYAGAFAWAVTTGNVEAASTISANLIWAALWHDTGEPYLWVQTVAAMPGAAESPLWSSVLAGCAWAAWESGQMQPALDLGLTALAAERPGRPNLDYMAEFAIMSAHVFLGQLDLAEEYLDRAVAGARADGLATVEAAFWSSYAIIRSSAEHYDDALAEARRAHRLGVASGNPNAIAWALAQEGVALDALAIRRPARCLPPESPSPNSTARTPP